MSIWTHAQQDEVKDGESSGVFLSELGNERGFVIVGQFFEVVEQGGVDGMDVGTWDSDMCEEFFEAEFMIRVWMIVGYDAFVCIVDFPVFSTQVSLFRFFF